MLGTWLSVIFDTYIICQQSYLSATDENVYFFSHSQQFQSCILDTLLVKFL